MIIDKTSEDFSREEHIQGAVSFTQYILCHLDSCSLGFSERKRHRPGLAAVHGIVKSHGGAILVESWIDKGTKFEVYLPLTIEHYDTEKNDESPIVGGIEQILLVDDEDDMATW